MENNIYASIHKLQQEHESFKVERDGVNRFINDVTRRLNAVEQSVHLPEEFINFKDFFTKELEEWRTHHKQIFDLYCKLNDEQEKKEKVQGTLASAIQILKDSLIAEVEFLKEELKKLKDHFAVTFRDNLTRMDDLKKQTKNEIEKLREEISVSPKSILETNEEILKKLSIASLDGQNAMMKINNIDLTVKMFERRIEQLLGKISHLELSINKE